MLQEAYAPDLANISTKHGSQYHRRFASSSVSVPKTRKTREESDEEKRAAELDSGQEIVEQREVREQYCKGGQFCRSVMLCLKEGGVNQNIHNSCRAKKGGLQAMLSKD